MLSTNQRILQQQKLKNLSNATKVLAIKIDDIYRDFDEKSNTLFYPPEINILKCADLFCMLSLLAFNFFGTLLVVIALTVGGVRKNNDPLSSSNTEIPVAMLALLGSTMVLTPVMVCLFVFIRTIRHEKNIRKIYYYEPNTLAELSAKEHNIRNEINPFLDKINIDSISPRQHDKISTAILRRMCEEYLQTSEALNSLSIDTLLTQNINILDIEIPNQKIADYVNAIPCRKQKNWPYKKPDCIDQLLAWRLNLTKQTVDESRTLVSNKNEIAIDVNDNFKKYSSFSNT